MILAREQVLAIGAKMALWLPSGHVLRPDARVQCQGGGIATGRPCCTNQARYCEYMRWSCDPKGISFFYYCPDCWTTPSPGDGTSPQTRANRLPIEPPDYKWSSAVLADLLRSKLEYRKIELPKHEWSSPTIVQYPISHLAARCGACGATATMSRDHDDRAMLDEQGCPGDERRAAAVEAVRSLIPNATEATTERTVDSIIAATIHRAALGPRAS